MEKQPECSLPDCPMIKKYGDRKIHEGWEYFYCPEGGEAYCLMELMLGRPLHSSHLCPVHKVKLKRHHYPTQIWDEK